MSLSEHLLGGLENGLQVVSAITKRRFHDPCGVCVCVCVCVHLGFPTYQSSQVCMKTGWSSRFHDITLYRNADTSVEHKCYPGGTMHFPGFSGVFILLRSFTLFHTHTHRTSISQEVAEFLTTQRNIHGVAIDTLSLDPGISETFPCHVTMVSPPLESPASL